MVQHRYLHPHPQETSKEKDTQELSILPETAQPSLKASFSNQIPSGQYTMGIQR